MVDAVSLPELKSHLNLAAATSEDDAELAMHLAAATRAIEKRIGPVVHTEFTERATPTVNGRLILSHTPVDSITALTSIGGVVRAVDTVHVDAASGIVSGTAGWLITGGDYDITYIAGHGATAHPDHKMAILYVAEHLWEMQQGSGVGGRPGVFGDDSPNGEESARYFYRGFALPRRALELISGDEQIGFA